MTVKLLLLWRKERDSERELSKAEPYRVGDLYNIMVAK